MKRTEEQAELAAIVRSMLDKRADRAAVRVAMATDAGFDADLWQTLCQQIGVTDADLTLAETCIVLKELGRSLAPTPLLPTALAAAALLDAGDPEGLLPRIEAGEIATVATPDHVLFGAQAQIVLAYVDGHLTQVPERPTRWPRWIPPASWRPSGAASNHSPTTSATSRSS